MKHISSLFVAIAALIATPAMAKTLTVAAGANAQERLQTALIDAKPGDIVAIGAGRFDLTDGLSLTVDNVTISGEGPDRTFLSFKGQKGAGEGLLVTSDDVALTGFTIEDSRGDGIKSKGADRIVYANLRVEWTGGPKESNGSYGIYPVESQDVLIDQVVVKGASDAGIYVGQSRNIIVRNSTAMFNVAGIEIENCYGADVYSNVAMHNTGGILVFDLPNLPQMGGHDIRIFSNRIEQNDTPNFAPKGNIVASVPVGTGVMVMASRNVHVFNNAIGENSTANVLVIGFPREFNDKTYNPLPRDVVIGPNRHGRGGWAPQLSGGRGVPALPPGVSFPILWDGAGSGIAIHETVPALSLGMWEGTTLTPNGKAGPVDLSQAVAIARPNPIVLPEAMAARAR
ncbi:MAG: parallel beta-helix domain-containing protein [Sphingomonadaceae bacterium]